jgi:hypothetical protein
MAMAICLASEHIQEQWEPAQAEHLLSEMLARICYDLAGSENGPGEVAYVCEEQYLEAARRASE